MRTMTAMYDTRADAERVQAELERLGIVDTDGASLQDQSSAGFSRDSYSTPDNRGFWANLKGAFLPDEDRHFYEEGVRRGGYLLTVTVDEEKADDAHRILESSNAVNVDEREAEYRKSGWAPAAATGAAGYSASGVPATGSTPGVTGSSGLAPTAQAGTEERIPVVEEELAIGKREVSRGGVRVRSYVRQVPVHEQVSLREEHVDVERRPVDQPLSAANLTGDAFQERNIEVTETAEEAVVAKNARVVEEVVVRKGVEERVENVDDTVRRTEVDVERLNDADRLGTDRLAAGTGSLDRSATDLDSDGRGAGSEARGLGNEALGNVKQGLGGLTGSDAPRRDGAMQERQGEVQQGKGPDGANRF